MIKEIIDHDVVLIPFFADKASEDDKQTVLVSLTPSKWKTDLFWSESRNTQQTSSDYVDPLIESISQEVINIYSAIGQATGKHFDESMIDGGINTVCVTCEEDYLISMIYIADCYTFKRAIDLECFNLDRERNKMVDTLLRILDFA
jgi:hypothetical protein